MTVFDEAGAGGSAASGAAVVAVRWRATTAFRAGEAAYVAAQARIGVLERLIVRAVRVVNRHPVTHQPVSVCKDHTGRFWFESDLMDYDTAVELAGEYHLSQLERFEEPQ